MTGFRVGYLIANNEITKAMNKLQSHLNGNVTPFVQYGAESALRSLPPKQIALTEIFQKRRDIALKHCLEIFPCVPPGGAFYLYPNVAKFLGSRFNTSEELATFILEKTKVAILPSEYFGDTDHLRFSFAASESDIIEAFARIKKALT
jgi:aspartate aminotransferase